MLTFCVNKDLMSTQYKCLMFLRLIFFNLSPPSLSPSLFFLALLLNCYGLDFVDMVFNFMVFNLVICAVHVLQFKNWIQNLNQMYNCFGFAFSFSIATAQIILSSFIRSIKVPISHFVILATVNPQFLNIAKQHVP